MDTLFVTRVIISFLVAGTLVALATWIAERFGSIIGGLIGNLPSNILVSLLFLAIVNDATFVVGAVPAIPVGMTIDSLFLFSFVLCLRYGLLPATIVSLLLWFVLALAAMPLHWDDLLLNIIFYVVITVTAFVVLERGVKIPAVKQSPRYYTKMQMLVRAIFAGTVVSSVVVISKFFNPYIVGIFATFPAVLLTTMIILARNQNHAFAQATGKILILSSSNIIVYGVAVYFTYPVAGITLGTVISFILACLWVGLVHPMLRKLT